MADQEKINLRKQRSRIDLSQAVVQRVSAESGNLVSKRAKFRRDCVTSAAASTAVGGLPTKRLWA